MPRALPLPDEATSPPRETEPTRPARHRGDHGEEGEGSPADDGGSAAPARAPAARGRTAGRRAPRAGTCGSPGATPSTRCARSRPRARLCPRCSHRRHGDDHDGGAQVRAWCRRRCWAHAPNPRSWRRSCPPEPACDGTGPETAMTTTRDERGAADDPHEGLSGAQTSVVRMRGVSDLPQA